jgi:hypothetical protein
MLFSSLYKSTFGEHADLEKIAGKYPYFSPAHFFLLQQTAPGSGNYNEIAAKTALHFANPFLLNRHLNEEEIKPADIPVLKNDPVEIETPAILPAEEATTESYDHRVEVVEEPVIIKEEIVTPEAIIKEEAKEEKSIVEAKRPNHPPLLF